MPLKETNRQIEDRLEQEAHNLVVALCALGSGSFENAQDLVDLCRIIDEERRDYVSSHLIRGTEHETMLALNFLAKAFFRQFLKPLSRGTFSARLIDLVEETGSDPDEGPRPTLHFLKLLRWRYVQLRSCNDKIDEDFVPEGFADKTFAQAVSDVLFTLVSRSTSSGVYPMVSDPVERELARLDRNVPMFDVPCLTVLRWNSLSMVTSTSTSDPRTSWSVAKQIKRVQNAANNTTKRISYAHLRDASKSKKTGSKKKAKGRSDRSSLIALRKACRDSIKDAYTYEEKKCTVVLETEYVERPKAASRPRTTGTESERKPKPEPSETKTDKPAFTLKDLVESLKGVLQGDNEGGSEDSG